MQQYLLCIPKHIIVYHLSSRMGWVGDPVESICFHARDLPQPSLIGKYKQSSDELYREPKEETVLGSFLSRNQKEPERHVKSRETMQGKNENPISSHHLK